MEKKYNVIVLEDDESQIDTLYKLLEIYMPEYNFDIFQESKKALAKFTKNMYSLAIVDLVLKGSKIQGQTFIKEVRKIDPLINIIVVTGLEYEAPPLDAVYKDLNVRKWMKKPVKASVLENTIREIFERKS